MVYSSMRFWYHDALPFFCAGWHTYFWIAFIPFLVGSLKSFIWFPSNFELLSTCMILHLSCYFCIIVDFTIQFYALVILATLQLYTRANLFWLLSVTFVAYLPSVEKQRYQMANELLLTYPPTPCLFFC